MKEKIKKQILNLWVKEVVIKDQLDWFGYYIWFDWFEWLLSNSWIMKMFNKETWELNKWVKEKIKSLINK